MNISLFGWAEGKARSQRETERSETCVAELQHRFGLGDYHIRPKHWSSFAYRPRSQYRLPKASTKTATVPSSRIPRSYPLSLELLLERQKNCPTFLHVKSRDCYPAADSPNLVRSLYSWKLKSAQFDDEHPLPVGQDHAGTH